MGSARYPLLWIERLSGRLGLSYFWGAILLVTLPTALGFFVSNYLQGSYESSSPAFAVNVFSLITVIPLPLVCLLGARLAVKKIEELGEYSKTLNSEISVRKHNERLASLKFLAVIYIALAALIVAVLSGGGQPLSSAVIPFVVGVSAALYTILAVATLMWTFGYSMYAVHELGSQKLKLASFAEDKTLGLKPFGLTTFSLTLVYLGTTAYLLLSINVPPLPLEFTLALLSLLFIAIPLFLLPLRTLRRQLISAKSKDLEWTGRRYAEILSRIRASGDGPLDEGTKSDLAAIRQLQEDIRSVHNWPFETGVLTRLLAIILSVSAILLSAYIRDLLKF